MHLGHSLTPSFDPHCLQYTAPALLSVPHTEHFMTYPLGTVSKGFEFLSPRLPAPISPGQGVEGNPEPALDHLAHPLRFRGHYSGGPSLPSLLFPCGALPRATQLESFKGGTGPGPRSLRLDPNRDGTRVEGIGFVEEHFGTIQIAVAVRVRIAP